MSSIKVKSYAEIATLTVGAKVNELQLESYEVNTGKGGGRFARAPSTLPAVEGFRVKTKDGQTFERQYDEETPKTIKAEYLGWLFNFEGDAVEFLNRLFKAGVAAKLPVELPKSFIFRCGAALALPAGLPGIYGNGSFLYFYYNNANLQGLISADGIKDCVIRELNIDFDRGDDRIKSVIGIWLRNQQNCQVIDCNIASKENHSFLARAGGALKEPNVGLVVENVRTYVQKKVEDDARQNFLFDLDDSTKMDTVYKETQTVPERVGHKGYVVRGCEAYNGRYGFGGSWCEKFTIENCTAYCNTRSISFQNNPRNNVINGFRAYEALSASIHLNYGPKGNRVENTIVKSSRANNQGALHVSLDADGNVCENIDIEITSPAGLRWAIYGGANFTNNVFRNIIINAPCYQGLMVFESGWEAGDEHGGYGGVISRTKGADVGKWQTKASDNNLIENITVYTSTKSPALVIAAVKENMSNFTARNITINGDAMSKTLRVVETGTAKVSGIDFDNVQVDLARAELGALTAYKRLSVVDL